MSRLESFIRRLEAQRACLDASADAIRHVPGIVFELGLGNGRTYDHLRQLLPDRRILVFERELRPHPQCCPAEEDLVIGDLEITLPRATPQWSNQVALVHSDIGTGEPERNRRVAAALAVLLPPFLKEGGILLSDQALPHTELDWLPPPAGTEADRYFFYRRSRAGRGDEE